MQTNRFAQMDNEIKSMRQSMEKHLADMYKGFADISALSSGVSDLKKVLSNVKTRGILGEIQLGATSTKYLHRSNSTPMLQPYRTVPQLLNLRLNFRTTTKDLYIFRLIQNSRLTPYNDLLNAYDTGDSEIINRSSKALVQRIKQSQKIFTQNTLNRRTQPILQ